eukprot:SAG11_NODE_35067_length_268_cov_1.207101_1_plen_21_part_10
MNLDLLELHYRWEFLYDHVIG